MFIRTKRQYKRSNKTQQRNCSWFFNFIHALLFNYLYSWILWICKDTKLQRSFFFYLASWILRSISPFKSYRIEISLRAPILFNAFFKGLTLGFFIMALLFYFIYYLMPWLIEPIETSIRFLSILNTLFSNKEIPPVVGMTHRLSFWSKR